MRRYATRLAIGALLCMGLSLFESRGEALPRFAASDGAHCSKCHINPTGGGARNRFGRNVFAPRVLNAGVLDGPTGLDTEITVGSNFGVAFGADARLAYFWQQRTDENLNSFFPMQADLYVTGRLGDYATVYVDRGLTNFEAFGMVHDAERSAWAKLGQFVMPYGLRLANHTTFVRGLTGFDPRGIYYGLDVGGELGAEVGPVRLIGAVANGISPESGEGRPFDDNQNKAFYGTAEYAFTPGLFRGRVGASGYYNFAGHRSASVNEAGQIELEEDTRNKTVQGALFASLALGRFTLVHEVDLQNERAFDTDAATLEETIDETTSWAMYDQLVFRVVRGVDAKATFELSNPDVDAADDEEYRIGGGAELFPLTGVEVNLLYRHTVRVDDRDDVNEILTYAHFYF